MTILLRFFVLCQHIRKGLAFWGILVGILLGSTAIAHAQRVDTLRLMQYNLTNYGNNFFSCNATTNGLAKKDSLLRRIVGYARPDMLGCNEVGSNTVLSDRILSLVLNANGLTRWARAVTNNRVGSDLVNAFFYDSTKLGLKSQGIINSAIRIMDHYRMFVKPEAGITDTLFFNVVVAHLKAGNTAADRVDREAMVSVLNTYLSSKDTAEGYVFQGDINVYASTEVNYQLLVNPAQGGYFIDPINRPGAWNNNSSFADVHTQCPSTATGGCFSGGGMDDRFDQQLVTRGMLRRTGRVSYASTAFRVLGNDGRHFNQNITDGTNTSVPGLVANALVNMSDHLPIMGKIVVRTPTATQVSFTRPTVKAWLGNDGLHVQGLSGKTTATFYSTTGATLGQALITSDAPVSLPTYLPQTGTLLVHLQPLDTRQLPTTIRVMLTPSL